MYVTRLRTGHWEITAAVKFYLFTSHIQPYDGFLRSWHMQLRYTYVYTYGVWWMQYLVLLLQNPACISLLSHACYKPCPSHLVYISPSIYYLVGSTYTKVSHHAISFNLLLLGGPHIFLSTNYSNTLNPYMQLHIYHIHFYARYEAKPYPDYNIIHYH